MFTGIVQAVGRIESVKPFVVHAGGLPLRGVRIGDSVSVRGACLTVTRKRGKRLSFDVSRETLRVTAGLDRKGPVNLENALRLGDPLGGHLVTGHVDGVGKLVRRKGSVFTFRAPKALSSFLASKGSICVDGVSLTVNKVARTAFEVNLVPHTLRRTTLGRLAPGERVNLEVDLVARYVASLF
jgi:riboflavin synthase